MKRMIVLGAVLAVMLSVCCSGAFGAEAIKKITPPPVKVEPAKPNIPSIEPSKPHKPFVDLAVELVNAIGDTSPTDSSKWIEGMRCFDIEIKNIGTKDSGAFVLKFSCIGISGSSVNGTTPVCPLEEYNNLVQNITNMAAGQTGATMLHDCGFTHYYWKPGKYHITVQADPGNHIPEPNKQNNTWDLQFEIFPAPK